MVNQTQETQSPIQDKYKEKYVETHTNQTNKEIILKAGRGKQQATCKGNPIRLTHARPHRPVEGKPLHP